MTVYLLDTLDHSVALSLYYSKFSTTIVIIFEAGEVFARVFLIIKVFTQLLL